MPRFRGASLLLLSLLASFIVAAPRVSFAADDATLARAKAHFENGVHLYDQQPPDYEGALAEFRAAEKEHPSPGLKRNVALCLKALHRYGEAMDELDAMLATTEPLKPETREAGKKLLAELQALVATLRIRVVLHRASNQTSGDVPRVDVSIDGVSVPGEKLGGAVRTGPGDHVIIARAQGYGDTTKKVSVVSGDKDVPVQLDLIPVVAGTALGNLRLHASKPKAAISIDGVALANGSWEGSLPAGSHHIEVSAEGVPTWTRDIQVAAGEHVDLEATLGNDVPPPPPPYGNGNDKVTPPAKQETRPWWLAAGVGVFGGTYATGGGVVGTAGRLGDKFSTERGFAGGAITARLGREIGKFVELMAFLELGLSKPTNWKDESGANRDITIGYGALGPGLRVHSPGKVFRVVVGTELGLQVVGVTANNIPQTLGSTQTENRKGGGVEGVWQLEAGPQIRMNERLFLEADLFFSVSGDGSIKDNTTSERYFVGSPVTQAGLRAFFGFTF